MISNLINSTWQKEKKREARAQSHQREREHYNIIIIFFILLWLLSLLSGVSCRRDVALAHFDAQTPDHTHHIARRIFFSQVQVTGVNLAPSVHVDGASCPLLFFCFSYIVFFCCTQRICIYELGVSSPHPPPLTELFTCTAKFVVINLLEVGRRGGGRKEGG